MADALSLSDRAPGPLGPHTTLDEIPDSALREHGDLVATCINHRVRLTSEVDWHIENQLNAFAKALMSVGVDELLIRSLAESAISIGLHRATVWVE